MRRHIPALSLLGSLILLPACATKQSEAAPPDTATSTAALSEPASEAEPDRPNDRRRIELIRLQHASAEELAAVVSDLIEDARGVVDADGPRTIADPRTNALIVLGNEDELASIKDLVARLDVTR